MTATTTTGWVITTRPVGLTFKLIARSADGKRAIHRDKFTAEQVEAFDPDADWAYGIQQMRARTTTTKGTTS